MKKGAIHRIDLLIVAMAAFIFQGFLLNSAKAQDALSPLEIVKSLISPYCNRNAAPPDDDFVLMKIGTPEMVDLIWSDLACRIENEQICGLDLDPIIWAQDFNIRRLKIVALPKKANRQSVLATFLNGDHPTSIRYDFIKIDGRWRLRDIDGDRDTKVRKTLLQRLRENY